MNSCVLCPPLEPHAQDPIHSSAHSTVAYKIAASQHTTDRNSNMSMFLGYLPLVLAAKILHDSIT
jgi:hypothetical protein